MKTQFLRCLLSILVTAFIPSIGRAAPPGVPVEPSPQFFDQFDLTRPGLAAVRTAVGKSDWAGARHALAEYLRTRQTPHWNVKTGNSRQDVARANKVLAHRLESIGIEWQCGDTIDWGFNPTTQPGSRWPRNHEWTWQLNRHSAWTSLARAFQETGDEKYAKEFAAEFKAWAGSSPVPLSKAANSPFSRWRTIEAGIRAGSVWPEIFFKLLEARAFDDEALALMLQSFADHARYLMKFPTHGNWLTMEANGLYHVGALFPEFKEAPQWRETAAARLYAELDAQVYPDGAQIELAPGYHGVTIRNFLGPVNLVPVTGIEPPAGYLPKMERLFDYFLYSMQPDGRTPALNDSGAGSIAGYMRDAARLFPQRQDFRWAATGGRQGQPPAHTSHEFPYAGQFILRSGWDPKAAWLCMDGGPFGFGHQHEDKLGVTLTACGEPLLVEGGVYTYDDSAWRRYVLSSHAHNVVLVDGLEQHRRREPRETFVVKTPLPHVWETSSTFDHAAACYNEGWGPKGERRVRQTRHVFFLKPDLFVIADQFEPADAQAHTYEALFHLDAPEARVDGLRVVTQNTGPNLTIAGYGLDRVKVVKGQKEPIVQGWLPTSSGGYGSVRPIPTAIYAKTAQGPTTLLFALRPTPKGMDCPAIDVKLNGDQLTVRVKGEPERTLRFKNL